MALRDNLVSWWALEETSGSRADSHGSNTLTDNNTVTSATGKISTAASFASASSEYLSITDASQSGLDITADITIQAWLYIPSAPATDVEYSIVTKLVSGGSSAFALRYGNFGGVTKLAAMMFDSSAPSTNVNYNINQTLSTSTWYHIVFTFKSSTSTAEWFVNGSSIGTVTDAAVNDINNSSGAFYIGAFAGLNRFMNGRLDEVAIWSRVLTGSEITSLYNSGNGLSYAATAGATIVTPSAQVATFSIPAYTAKHGSTLSPSSQVSTFSIPTYSVKLGCTVSPSTQTATFTIPVYVAGGNKIVSPSAKTLTFSIPTYQIKTYILLTPNGQTLTFTIPLYTVVTEANITITPNTIVLTFITPTLAKFGAVWTKRGRSTNASWVKSTRNSN